MPETEYPQIPAHTPGLAPMDPPPGFGVPRRANPNPPGFMQQQAQLHSSTGIAQGME